MSVESSSTKEKGKSVKTLIPSFNKLTPFLVIASIGLAFAVGILWQKVQTIENGATSKVSGSAGSAGNNQPPQQPPQGSAKDVEPVTKEDHVRGDRNARIALIEYSDFECPFCGQFHPTAQQVIDEYAGQVMWVYRHFPLDQIHSNARPAAEASECVSEIGGGDAFWKFADEIFNNQQTALEDLKATAVKIGIDGSSFDSCFNAKKYAQRVEDNYQSGINTGVTGTPGNILLDTKTGETILIPGALPYEQLKQSIDSLLTS
jgi:protein-disulfide isomerase